MDTREKKSYAEMTIEEREEEGICEYIDNELKVMCDWDFDIKKHIIYCYLALRFVSDPKNEEEFIKDNFKDLNETKNIIKKRLELLYKCADIWEISLDNIEAAVDAKANSYPYRLPKN